MARLALTLLGLVFALVFATSQAQAKPKKRFGKLVVMSMTSGADIFIDGKRVGAVPRDRPFTLSAGEHTLRVELRGYATSERKVTIKRGRTLEIEADLLAFAGILLVETEGVTATVVVDGKPQGPTPFDGDVAIGTRIIEVRAPGRIPFRTEMLFKGGKLYPLSVDLEIDPNAPPPAAVIPPVAGDDGDDDEGGGFDLGLPEGWYKEPWVLIGAGTAVVVAITAAIFLSADDDGPSGPPPESTLPVGAGYR